MEIFSSIFKLIIISWKPVLEISIISVIFYIIYLFIEGTRTMQVFKGLIILFVIYFISSQLDFPTINWLMKKIFAVAAIGIMIIFQPELRKGLAEIGRKEIFSPMHYDEAANVGAIIAETAFSLAEKKIGALIAIARSAGMKNYIDTGVIIDARISVELLSTIFMPRTILHDGGVIIEDIRVSAAGCLFPLYQRADISRSLGTRHRAAIGLTEETDALVIVVSEETGGVSIASRGKLSRDIEKDTLEKVVNHIYENPQKKESKLLLLWKRMHAAR
jgi:diadenylate cyclase